MPKWTAQDVRQHLQWACDLELFTLPLYLTAAYSIKAPIVNGSPMYDPHIGWEFDDNWSESQRAQWAFNIVYSVAIQEMLHLMLARNVATALGRTVVIDQPPAIPNYDTGGIVPHLLELDPKDYKEEANIAPFQVRLGPLDENQINLFLAIEVPEELVRRKRRPHHGPNAPYRSIGEFYDALVTGIRACWDDLYQHQNASYADLYQYGAYFADDYDPVYVGGDSKPGVAPDPPYTPADAKKTIADILHMIIEQGEGGVQTAVLVYERLGVARLQQRHPPVRFPVRFPGAKLEEMFPDDSYSHWGRFSALKPHVLAGQIPTWGTDGQASQWHLKHDYAGALKVLTAGFDPANYPYEPVTLPFLNLASMWSMGGHLTQLWANNTQPDFEYDKTL